MSRVIHIAILECDTPVPPVQARFGTYGDIFQKFLQSGFKSLGLSEGELELQVSKWNVVEGNRYPRLEAVDGILLTGSSALDSGDSLEINFR